MSLEKGMLRYYGTTRRGTEERVSKKDRRRKRKKEEGRKEREGKIYVLKRTREEKRERKKFVGGVWEGEKSYMGRGRKRGRPSEGAKPAKRQSQRVCALSLAAAPPKILLCNPGCIHVCIQVLFLSVLPVSVLQ